MKIRSANFSLGSIRYIIKYLPIGLSTLHTHTRVGIGRNIIAAPVCVCGYVWIFIQYNFEKTNYPTKRTQIILSVRNKTEEYHNNRETNKVNGPVPNSGVINMSLDLDNMYVILYARIIHIAFCSLNCIISNDTAVHENMYHFQ